LCEQFCSDIFVKEVEDGMAISVGMAMDGGDRITIVWAEEIDGSYLVDDGDFLSALEASDTNIRTGPRAEFIDSILKTAGAYWDRDTYEIRTETTDGPIPPERIIEFLTVLVRIRDVRYWTRDVVRSTFKADVTELISKEYSICADIEESCPVNDNLKEFPADIVVRPRIGGRVTAVYLVNSNDGLNESLALWQEAQRLGESNFNVMTIIEDGRLGVLSEPKKQRMQNRIDAVAIYKGDEMAAIERVGRIAGLPQRIPIRIRS
jgi:Domain of unknown function DUF1828